MSEDGTKKNRSLADKILKAGALVGLAHILLKFAGLIQTKVATHYLESTVYESIIVVAFAGVINTLFFVGQELIAPTFLSVFMKEKEKNGESSAWKYAGTVLSFQALLLMIVSATIALFPDFFIHLLTSWTMEKNPTEYRLLRLSLQILAPSLFFLSLGSTTYGLLNGYKKFFMAAFGDASTKICVIIGLIVGIGLFGWDYRVLLFSIVVGSIAKVLTHLAGLGKLLKNLVLSLNWHHPAFKSMLLLMLPLLIGVIFAKVRDNFNNIYILTRIDQKGILMANDLGRKLFATIQWLVPYSLQIALFPFLCELASKNDREKLGEVLGNSCRLMLSIFVPAALILSVLATPLSVLIFIGGKTGLEIASWAGVSTACYCLVLPAAAVECVLMQGLFADQRTTAVTVIGICTSLISVILSYIFIIVMKVEPVYAIMTVALGFALSRTVKSIILALYIKRKLPIFPARETWIFIGKLLAVSLIVGGCTYLVSRGFATVLPDGIDRAFQQPADASAALASQVSRVRIALRIVCSGVCGGCVYLLASFIFRLAEPKQMLSWTLAKVLKKKKSRSNA